MNLTKLAPYAKALAAGAAAVGVTASALADGKLDSSELSAIVIAWAGVLAVYHLPNKQG